MYILTGTSWKATSIAQAIAAGRVVESVDASARDSVVTERIAAMTQAKTIAGKLVKEGVSFLSVGQIAEKSLGVVLSAYKSRAALKQLEQTRDLIKKLAALANEEADNKLPAKLLSAVTNWFDAIFEAERWNIPFLTLFTDESGAIYVVSDNLTPAAEEYLDGVLQRTDYQSELEAVVGDAAYEKDAVSGLRIDMRDGYAADDDIKSIIVAALAKNDKREDHTQIK